MMKQCGLPRPRCGLALLLLYGLKQPVFAGFCHQTNTAMNTRHFTGYSGAGQALCLVGELAAADRRNRSTYNADTFDVEGRLTRCEKLASVKSRSVTRTAITSMAALPSP